MLWTKHIRSILLGLILLQVLWASLSLALASPLLPTPWAVYAQLPELVSGQMAAHLGISVWRVLMGIGLSLALALPLALALFSSQRIGRMLEALIYLSYPIPKLALLPIVMLMAGLGEATKVIMIVLIILFQLVIGLRDSLRSISRDSIALMHSLGASPWQSIKHLYFPAILPDIYGALRIALGTALSVLFVTETYGTSQGMGYYIVDAWMRVNYLDMYAGIVLLGLVGFLFFALIDLLEYLSCPWRRA